RPHAARRSSARRTAARSGDDRSGCNRFSIARHGHLREPRRDTTSGNVIGDFDAAKRAIVALVSEPTIERAATRCGIGERTLRRWLSEDDAFKTDYEAARRATFQAPISRILAPTAKVVDTLDELLSDTKHPAVRLGAARTIADIGLHQYEADAIVR